MTMHEKAGQEGVFDADLSHEWMAVTWEACDKFEEVSIGCGLGDALKGFIPPSEEIQEPNRYLSR